MRNGKYVILWTCDVVGWAYYNRIQRISAAMPQYEHVVWFFGNSAPLHEKQAMLAEADVIVCQGVKAMRIAQLKPLDFSGGVGNAQKMLDARFDNMIVRLDSMRVDFKGDYFDIWTGEKLPG